jgi:hypothetical protein
MSLDALKSMEIIETMENFLDRFRPKEEIRDQIDITYKIDGQSILIYEIRPFWKDQHKKIESPAAKTTYIKSKNHWKIFWMRADLKWHSYGPIPAVKTLKEFIQIVEDDNYGCFWG